MRKRILGYLFYVLGFVCWLSVVASFKEFLFTFSAYTKAPDAYLLGVFVGRLAVLIVVTFLGFVFFKYARRWTKIEHYEIDQIGKKADKDDA